ncbi:DNA cytosine methyltransferase [Actinomadura rubrisoli]|uniref:DNA cytosine methyltransferase n=1 Tax=Actinomadura rubrisoli TaxID=2530368 RepID=UPI003C7D4D5A
MRRSASPVTSSDPLSQAVPTPDARARGCLRPEMNSGVASTLRSVVLLRHSEDGLPTDDPTLHFTESWSTRFLVDNGDHRYRTVRETARVMTFPDDWTLVGPRGEKMRQLGNAVPVLLGQVSADAQLGRWKEGQSPATRMEGEA